MNVVGDVATREDETVLVGITACGDLDLSLSQLLPFSFETKQLVTGAGDNDDNPCR